MGSPRNIDIWLRSVWRIVPDPDAAEFVRGPRLQLDGLITNGYLAGDCDDAATFAASLLYALGMAGSLVAYRWSGPDFQHVNVEATDGTQIDPIVTADKLPIDNAVEYLPMEL